MTEIKNAKITGTSLGNDDHGPSFWLSLDYGGMGQGFGGYKLGGEFTHYVVMGILNTVGVDKWEELKGKPIRAKLEDGIIRSIGHFLDDKWFTPSDFNK